MNCACHLHEKDRQSHRECAIDPHDMIQFSRNDGIRDLIVRTQSEQPSHADCDDAAEYLTTYKMPRLSKGGFYCAEGKYG